MTRTLWIALLVCNAGCMQFHDGWLGRDQRPSADGGAADAGDGGMKDSEDEEEEEDEKEGDDQEDFTRAPTQR